MTPNTSSVIIWKKNVSFKFLWKLRVRSNFAYGFKDFSYIWLQTPPMLSYESKMCPLSFCENCVCVPILLMVLRMFLISHLIRLYLQNSSNVIIWKYNLSFKFLWKLRVRSIFAHGFKDFSYIWLQTTPMLSYESTTCPLSFCENCVCVPILLIVLMIFPISHLVRLYLQNPSNVIIWKYNMSFKFVWKLRVRSSFAHGFKDFSFIWLQTPPVLSYERKMCPLSFCENCVCVPILLMVLRIFHIYDSKPLQCYHMKVKCVL